MIEITANIALTLLALAMVLCLIRLLRGPDIADRILALDTLYINALATLIVLGIRLQNSVFFETALIIGMLGFVGTVVLSKYLIRGDIID
ncbi:MAG TPA: K+/H+ antiporter subunit F [Steroidobacteraceae bacterium]|nr:K+/H+ antiporter subunit F [Steroidobacteraceae bacterium]HRX89772.1 K+/H+ antiporter subunit F [Steroidobacteraceae bacterium]